ncbi:MAG: amidohydrolase family protein [Gemmatimonadaceae bacterium]|nr:amidohydrolase family protein [Gemmatimonadaceae bacterium]
MRPSALLYVVALSAACSTPTPVSRARPTPTAAVFPGADWERVPDPTAIGWSRARLDSVRATLTTMPTTAMMVVEHGRVVFEYGDLTTQSYLASVRKSVLSMLYGIEIARGRVDTAKTLAQLGIDDIGGLLPREREATVQDLLTARSGVYHPASNAGDNLADAPPRGSQPHGTYQLYSNWDFNAVGAIFEQMTGRNIYDAVETEIALPIGMQEWRRALQQKSGDTTASKYKAYHMFFSTRDMARIGYLMLRNGAWNGRQIVPVDWVRKSTSAITPVGEMHPASTRRGRFGYGYLWWPFDGDWNTGAYEGAYSAIGAVGQYITVIPKLDIVIAHKTAPRAGSNGVSHAAFWALVDRIVEARTGVRPQPRTRTIPPYDIIIRNGTVLDGSGSAAIRADVAILGKRIVRVSPTPLDPADAERVIDATGLTVAPGFIDLHAHLEPLFELPGAESHVRQGVTLALGGPDGGGPWPLGTYLDSADRAGLGMNVAYLAGHNTIRRAVMGTENREPTTDELAKMRAMVATAMREGAFGLSTGLRYVPGYYSKVDEVIALSEEAARRGGIYTSHLREEGVGLIDGVAEALEIGRRAKIPVVLTHHKAVGRQAWGKSVLTLAMVDSARQAGTDVMIDQYPYTASFTGLDVLVPPWALSGGREGLRQRLTQPALKDSITRGIIDLIMNDRGGGDISRVQLSIVAWDTTLQGKTLADWAKRRNLAPTPQNALGLILEGVLNGGAGVVYHVIEESDVRRIMAHPMTMIASDGRLTALGSGVPHPRNYGTFPRVLGRYVRDERVLTLPSAIHKMTGMPAARLGLRDRGCVRQGCVADLTLFDAATVRDVGSFTDPHHYSEGLPWVLVNGEPVVANGVFTKARPGRVVRRSMSGPA